MVASSDQALTATVGTQWVGASQTLAAVSQVSACSGRDQLVATGGQCPACHPQSFSVCRDLSAPSIFWADSEAPFLTSPSQVWYSFRSVTAAHVARTQIIGTFGENRASLLTSAELYAAPDIPKIVQKSSLLTPGVDKKSQ